MEKPVLQNLISIDTQTDLLGVQIPNLNGDSMMDDPFGDNNTLTNGPRSKSIKINKNNTDNDMQRQFSHFTDGAEVMGLLAEMNRKIDQISDKPASIHNIGSLS